MKCEMCNAEFLPATDHTSPYERFTVLRHGAGWDAERCVCSVSCLCDLAWKLREEQPKLSKFKETS